MREERVRNLLFGTENASLSPPQIRAHMGAMERPAKAAPAITNAITVITIATNMAMKTITAIIRAITVIIISAVVTVKRCTRIMYARVHLHANLSCQLVIL